MIPDHPIPQLLDAIELADRLGFYACYGGDETYHKDMWQILAAAATRTQRIRLGPDVTHVILKDPTLIAQQIATLDELTNGRAECGFSIGNFALLEQYHITELAARPLGRLREAYYIMRTMLDEGAIDFEGKYYRYSGLFTSARPVQKHLPIFLGAMLGPKTFQLAGEICDGMHHALAYSPQSMAYAIDNIKVGAERAGRDWRTVDIGTMVVATVFENARAAKDTARIFAAFYMAAMPPALLERHGIDPEDARPIVEAFNRGDVGEGIRLMPVEMSDRLSFAGTPEEIVERIRDDVVPSGFNHVIFLLSDPYVVENWAGVKIDGVPDLSGQLQLIHDRVMPSFA
jgi:5,10-methylenetetrahydromethanopterin reductase